MPLWRSPRFATKTLRYAVVAFLTTVALLLTASLPDHQVRSLFFVYLGAALVGSWHAGWKSGVLVSLLSGLGLLYWLAAPLQGSAFQSTHDLARFSVVSATTLLACWSLAALHYSQVALRKSNKKLDRAVRTLQAMIETMPMGVLAVEASSGRIMVVNGEAATITGLAKNVEYDRSSEVLQSGPQTLATACLARALNRGEVVDDLEFTVKTTTGLEKIVLMGAAPIRDSNGTIVGAVASFKDISAVKRAERSLRINEKLVATGRLAATIAHEINNPINSVVNLLYVLQGSQPGPKEAELLGMAQQQMLRMSHIVQQMLAFYRDTSAPSPVRISKILIDLFSLYAGNLHARNIQVESRYRFGGEIEAYGGELRQAISNIVMNAIESITDSGKIRARVSASKLWNQFGTPQVRITIADNGSGISSEHRGRVLEAFFSTKANKGTGLGLWVADGIVRKHGGSIHFHSSTHLRGHGTCFCVFLPIEAVQKKATLPSHSRISSAPLAM
jgi:two-component system CheB/CheR fusion protein